MVSPSFAARVCMWFDGGKPAGAGHVLHDHARIARDVPADMAREIAGVEVEAAARRRRRR